MRNSALSMLTCAASLSVAAGFFVTKTITNNQHTNSIITGNNQRSRSLHIILFEDKQANEETSDKEVQVGSKSYYEGVLSSPIQDETIQERGSGLEQALKLAAFFTVGLVLLVFGFMASNGLL